MYNIAWGIYSMVSGIGRLDDGSSCLLFFIFSGVLQGCPLAGSFFTIAMDPFLRHFEELIENSERGIVRACADDVGASLRDISSLSVMKCVFDSAETLAGLALKPTKVVIVPLSPRSWDMLFNFVRNWLSENIPEWRGFNIDLAAKYLGAYLGPHGGARIWSAAVAKWQSRAYVIAAMKAPLAVTVRLYNTRAVTTLSYLSQIAHLPHDVWQKDTGVLSRLLHMPHNSFTRASLYNLGKWGSLRITSAPVMAKAVLMRAALSTLTTWKMDLALLREAAEEHLPLVQVLCYRDSGGLLIGTPLPSPPTCKMLRWVSLAT